MQLPERFDLTYIGADGEKHRPVMIHRVVFGSLERIIGVLTEHFAGAFPLWLAPVQARLLPVTDRAAAYGEQLRLGMEQAGFRVELDSRSEKLGYKIRQAQAMKIPYMLIVGDQELADHTVSVRHRSGQDLGAMSPEALIALLQEEADQKIIK